MDTGSLQIIANPCKFASQLGQKKFKKAFPFFWVKWVYHKLYIFQFQIFYTNWPSLLYRHKNPKIPGAKKQGLQKKMEPRWAGLLVMLPGICGAAMVGPVLLHRWQAFPGLAYTLHTHTHYIIRSSVGRGNRFWVLIKIASWFCVF